MGGVLGSSRLAAVRSSYVFKLLITSSLAHSLISAAARSLSLSVNQARAREVVVTPQHRIYRFRSLPFLASIVDVDRPLAIMYSCVSSSHAFVFVVMHVWCIPFCYVWYWCVSSDDVCVYRFVLGLWFFNSSACNFLRIFVSLFNLKFKYYRIDVTIHYIIVHFFLGFWDRDEIN